MEDTTRKWATGCAIGCAIAIAILAVVIGAGYVGVKKVIRYAEDTATTMDQVSDRFGRTSDFRPTSTGVIAAERIEAFLEVRELTRPERERLEQTLADLAGTSSEAGGAPAGSLGSIRAGVGVVPQIMGYLNRRGEALLAAEIGLGEYLYLYTLIYPAWLGTPVDDGPPFVGSGSPQRWEAWIGEDTGGHRRDEISERLNRITLPMLKNQLEDAFAPADPGGAPDWTARLEGEIERMQQDHLRLPWQDGLPDRTAESLEPFRERLAASYSALCHPVELAVQQ
jgi:hypothetical protein